MVYNKERDAKRMALFPSLDYRGLYAVLVQLLEVTPLVQAGVDGKLIPSLFSPFVRSLARDEADTVVRSVRCLSGLFVCSDRFGADCESKSAAPTAFENVIEFLACQPVCVCVCVAAGDR